MIYFIMDILSSFSEEFLRLLTNLNQSCIGTKYNSAIYFIYLGIGIQAYLNILIPPSSKQKLNLISSKLWGGEMLPQNVWKFFED